MVPAGKTPPRGSQGGGKEQLAGHADDATHRLYTRPVPDAERPIPDGLLRAFSTELAE
jgi:hypothetical protein